jgi:RNA-directed DNA polymerase
VSGPALHAEKLTQSGTRWSSAAALNMCDPVVSELARCLMAGEQASESAFDRAGRMLGRRWRWLRPLALRYLNAFGGGTTPRLRDVSAFLIADAGFAQARAKYGCEIRVVEWKEEPPRMRPVAAARLFRVPEITTPGALADWLGIEPGELDWFADLKGLGHKRNHLLRHYRYRVLPKPSGGVRLIESPKPRLKELQRRILADILDKIPPHPAAHGFVKGRSIRTFVAPHVAQRAVLRMDLRDFFPTFPAARVQALFRTIGYPDAVASLFAGICTNAAPRELWKEFEAARALYAWPHLPQGAPTSPSLANLCARRMDCRLTGLAESAGAVYTRYADDLAFSGGQDFERRVERFSIHAAAILREEGFEVQHRKTRIMRQSVRQHLAGLVTNRRINVRRRDFDLLKATLTNCARLGPESQNREAHPHFLAHLEGRVAFVESIHREKGKKLREILARIEWPPSYN